MNFQNGTEWLWGRKSSVILLFMSAIAMLFMCLGAREIWTQEHRWADIVFTMLYNHDYLHPYLNGNTYYDKPLLSYWLISLFSFITGSLSTWALRLPSALAGLLSIWSIYHLGIYLKNRKLGLLAAWMLLTTFYFIFWARTSSADMLNMAGTLFAVTWYFKTKFRTLFSDYVIFFLILAATALCKGLLGPVVTVLAILPDLLAKGEWKKHLRFSMLFAIIPAGIFYVAPFFASTYFGGEHYQQNGLYQVYRENLLRYFQPFDHMGPIYTYFIFLPVYLLPWTFFFIPALFSLKSRWKKMSPNARWTVWAVVILFVFLTLSGSRRNYYILPVVPFAILMTADWILALVTNFKKEVKPATSNVQHITHVRTQKFAAAFIYSFFIIFFLNFGVAQPFYYARGGTTEFATALKSTATQVRPWSDWNVVMLDPESKVRFYLGLHPDTKNYGINGSERNLQTASTILKTWPMLSKPDKHTIYISRQSYEPYLKTILKDFDVVEAHPGLGGKLLNVKNANLPVAFLPKKDSV